MSVCAAGRNGAARAGEVAAASGNRGLQAWVQKHTAGLDDFGLRGSTPPAHI